MLLLVSIVVLAYFGWRGANPVGVALIALGVGIQLTLALRLVRSSVGGVGGHAEWVRDVSRRPRIERDPTWLGATALVIVGALVAVLV